MGERDVYDAMTFNELLSQWMQETLERDARKAKDYCPNNNRFHNFEKAVPFFYALGEINSREKVAVAFVIKHLVRLFDMLEIRDGSTKEDIDEVCGDIVAYINLVRGMEYQRSSYISD